MNKHLYSSSDSPLCTPSYSTNPNLSLPFLALIHRAAIFSWSHLWLCCKASCAISSFSTSSVPLSHPPHPLFFLKCSGVCSCPVSGSPLLKSLIAYKATSSRFSIVCLWNRTQTDQNSHCFLVRLAIHHGLLGQVWHARHQLEEFIDFIPIFSGIGAVPKQMVDGFFPVAGFSGAQWELPCLPLWHTGSTWWATCQLKSLYSFSSVFGWSFPMWLLCCHCWWQSISCPLGAAHGLIYSAHMGHWPLLSWQGYYWSPSFIVS